MAVLQLRNWALAEISARETCYFTIEGTRSRHAFLSINFLVVFVWASTPNPQSIGRVLSFFSSRRNWESSNPSPASEYAPPPGSGGRGTLAGERGFGGVPIPTRGHTRMLYSLYIYTYFVTKSKGVQKKQGGTGRKQEQGQT
jgi:hypothetical protein